MRTHLHIALLLALSCAPSWAAPSLSVTQTVDPEIYVRGRALEVTVVIDAAPDGESVFALGLEQALPSGWSFDGMVSSSTPLQIVPPPNDTGLLEFAFSGAVDTFPQSLIFEVRPGFSSTTVKTLSAKAIGIFSNSGSVQQQQDIVVEPDPDAVWMTIDTNRDGSITLTELLRLVQLYNSATGFHCDETAEDGFATGPGDRTCNNHTSDYQDGNWTIALSELLRAVQFYRFGAYYPCDVAEDGYCTGTP